jgi:hypothetical protein
VKKLIAVILAVVLVVAIAVPAFANGGTTDVTVTAGGGSPPIVKCKWETPDDGDTGSGTQVLPSGTYQVYKEVHFWAVVTDPEGVETVSHVFADVFHPAGPPENGSFKYQLELLLVDQAAGLAAFEAAELADLITYNTGHTPETVLHQLEQGLARVYEGTQVLSYHQPAGDYLVKVKAYDYPGNPSTVLENHFTYVAVTAMEVDFTTVNYGTVQMSINKWVGGDTTFGTANLPTVRNIGNTNLKITVVQDDMGLGDTSGEPNVMYDARLGANGVHAIYAPEQEVTLEDVLPLCNTQKLDFSIHVKKADPGPYSGSITLGAVFAPF